MRVQSYNHTHVDCREVLAALDSFPDICCGRCIGLDPKDFVFNERWKYGININYWRQNRVFCVKPSGDRDYSLPMEIISCCVHLHVMRELTHEQWAMLKEKLHDPFFVDRAAEAKRKAKPAGSRRVKGSSRLPKCQFCFEPIPEVSLKCPDCFP